MALGEQLRDPGVAGGAADSESVSLPPGTVWIELSESTTIGFGFLGGWDNDRYTMTLFDNL